MASYAVILLAAGKSSRFKNKEKKPYADLDGRAVWLRSLEIFSVRDDVKQILIVVADEDRELFERRYTANVAFLDVAKVVKGGAERHDSVRNALADCREDVDLIAVHDAARPCVTRELVDAVFAKAAETGAAILACPIAETLKRVADGKIVETLSRDGVWAAQTPQVFRRRILVDAYVNMNRVKGKVTDDAQLVEAMGQKVSIVESDASNIKVTTSKDLALATAILKGRPKPKDKTFHPFADEDMWR